MADTSMILPLCGRNMKHARKQYLEFVKNYNDIDNLPEFEFKDDVTEYRSEKSTIIRGYSIDNVAKYISDRLGLTQQLKFKSLQESGGYKISLCCAFTLLL